MAKKLSHTLVGGRTIVGTGGQTLKIGEQGRLYWMDVDEVSLIPTTWAGDRGVFMGGAAAWNSWQNTNNMDYITISSTGNGTDFGNLSVARLGKAGVSNGSRGVMMGGSRIMWTQDINTIDYFTFASPGNAVDFGDITDTRGNSAGTSNGTRGICAGGTTSGNSVFHNVIDYITIASTGNAADFGDLADTIYNATATSNGTKGFIIGGANGANMTDTIQYVTIDTTSNTSDWGNLRDEDAGAYGQGLGSVAGAESETRACAAGGNPGNNAGSNRIDYFSMDSSGDASDFGNLVGAIVSMAGTTNLTRGVFGGGGGSDQIQYITIASTGDATDFGDLIADSDYPAATSGD
jgi:hypothetical protein